MSSDGGAFRDAGAAIERLVILEQENEQLRAELDDLVKLRVQVAELEELRVENGVLRDERRSPNEGAFMRRLQEERLELTDEVRALRIRTAEQEAELTKLRKRFGNPFGPVDRVVTFVENLLAKKRE